MNKNFVDRAVSFSHEYFHFENFKIISMIVFLNHHPKDFIKKHINIRLKQIKIQRVYIF